MSIAGVFGGYYCSVSAILVVLTTIYVYDLFDKKLDIKENIVDLSFVGIITFMNILFFVVNDIFNFRVYTKNVFNFWTVSVIISQIISIIALVYASSFFVLNSRKGKVEIVENSKEENNEKTFDETEKLQKEEVKKAEMKSIPQNKEPEKTPFMEEEK